MSVENAFVSVEVTKASRYWSPGLSPVGTVVGWAWLTLAAPESASARAVERESRWPSFIASPRSSVVNLGQYAIAERESEMHAESPPTQLRSRHQNGTPAAPDLAGCGKTPCAACNGMVHG